MLELQEVDISKVSEALFTHRFNRDERPLKTSIQNFGIITPPSLLKQSQGHTIIDGWARLDIARKMGRTKVPCFVYGEDQLSKDNAFLLSLELNNWSREFNLVEKALCLKNAIEIFGGLNIPRSFWQVVGIKENIRHIHQYKELLRLPEQVQKYAVNNNIPLPTILGFLRFPKTEIETIANQLFILPLNQNKLGEILGLLLDISKREEVSPLKIMEKEFEEIENRHEYNAVQKEQILRRLLHKRRNPHYESKLDVFEDKVKQLSLAKNIKVTPSPYFEEDCIEIGAKIHSIKELEQFATHLRDDSWKKLFRDDEG